MRVFFKSGRPAGMTLVEVLVSMGVLSVVVPIVLAVMVRAGDTVSTTRAETRAPAIAERMRMEVMAARDGASEWFPDGEADFPEKEGEWVAGFGADGGFVRVLDRDEYQDGIDPGAGEDVFYLATVSSSERQDGRWMRVNVEHPVVKRAALRRVIDFHTRLP